MKNPYKIILFAFVALILSYALYMTFSDIKKNMKRESFAQDPKPNLKICLFKAEWCHHCTQYIKSNVYNDLFLNGDGKYENVVFATIDADKNQDMVKQYNINGFPTIVAIDQSGKLIDTFNADRNNKDDLIKFIKDNQVKTN